MLTREQILAADDRPREVVDVPEWGGTVTVAALSGKDRDAFESSIIGVDGRANMDNMRAKLAAACIIGDDGARMFTLGDVESLGQKSAAALERIVQVAQRLNRLGNKQLEELQGN